MTRNSRLLTIGLLVLALLGGLYVVRYVYYAKPRTVAQFAEIIGKDKIENGDLIFQTSLSGQSRAIQLATHSEYSHCGLIYKTGNDYFVFEAVQPVKRTPLAKWIARGQGGHFVIKRLKNADKFLTSETVKRMKQVGDSFEGKSYDIYFDWSDDKMYCSELIWKIYQRCTGLEIGKLEKLRDFDLTDGTVRKKMHDRYGDNIPLDELVISPASMFNSDLLITVKSN
jgi:hypothetical protein